MKRAVLTALVFAILALGSDATLSAHEEHERQGLGHGDDGGSRSRHAQGQGRQGRHRQGHEGKAKPTLKVEEIKAGTRVVITAVEGKDKTMTPKHIEVGAAPATGK